MVVLVVLKLKESHKTKRLLPTDQSYYHKTEILEIEQPEIKI